MSGGRGASGDASSYVSGEYVFDVPNAVPSAPPPLPPFGEEVDLPPAVKFWCKGCALCCFEFSQLALCSTYIMLHGKFGL